MKNEIKQIFFKAEVLHKAIKYNSLTKKYYTNYIITQIIL